LPIFSGREERSSREEHAGQGTSIPIVSKKKKARPKDYLFLPRARQRAEGEIRTKKNTPALADFINMKYKKEEKEKSSGGAKSTGSKKKR